MASKPESRLQKKIQDALEEEFPESFFYKTHGGPYQRKGVPDLIGCVEGHYIGLEVKVPGKEATLTALQKDTLGRIERAKGLGVMVTSAEQAVSAIKRYLKGDD